MALHDQDVLRTMACGIAGLSVAADSLSAIKYATVTPVRDERGLVVDYADRGRLPRRTATTTTASTRSRSTWSSASWRRSASRPTYRDALPTQSVLTITSNVVYGKATGNTPDGRRAGEPFAPGRQPDERARHPRDARLGAVGREAALLRSRGRHLPDQHRGPGRPRPHDAGAGSRTSRACSTPTSAPTGTT